MENPMTDETTDQYGSITREHMKRSMQYPAGYLSSRASLCERYEINWPQRVLIVLAVLCGIVEAAYQIGLKIDQHHTKGTNHENISQIHAGN